MKNISSILFSIFLFSNCNRTETVDLAYVTAKFKEYSGKIEKVEYNIQRIDTFCDGNVWNNKGNAFIERDRSDKIFGFSFYGKRGDIPKEYIYDKNFAFIINSEKGTYAIDTGSFGFIGRPGGQMVSQQIFYLDSIYDSVVLIKDEQYYVIKYQLKDDTVLNVTENTKIIKLKKDNFFPVEVVHTYKMLGNKAVNTLYVSDIKINNQVQTTIQDYKSKLKDLQVIQPEIVRENKVLHTKFSPVSLSNLLNESETITLKTNKLTLVDFWETWCGACILSLPKVEEIKNRYEGHLQVIGIASNDKENAVKLLKVKGITFTNLLGNTELLNSYDVNSFPRYFLIDKDGIVQKEYLEFSDQIEADIKEMIK